MGKESQSKDLERLGERLKGYLLAVQEIKSILLKEKEFKTQDNIMIDNLLQNILPVLKQAFNSETAFLAGADGRIYCVYPENSAIVGKKFPDTPGVKALVENEESTPLTADNSIGTPTELQHLNVRSLLVVRLETPLGKRFVGVSNGENIPSPYMSEDKKILEELMDILSIGLLSGQFHGKKEGKEEEKISQSKKHYLNAQAQGNWQYLSQASEDYAKKRLVLKPSISKMIDAEDNKWKKEIYKNFIDKLLCEFLNSELCNFIHSTLPSIKANQDIEHFEKSLRDRFLLLDEGKFKVIFKDNYRTQELSPGDLSRTAIAIVRICLFAKYFKKESESKEAKNKKPERNERSDSTQSPEWLWNIAKELLIKAAPEVGKPCRYYSFDWYVDWLRTKWQQIYYLARQGMMEPDDEKLIKIDKIYVNIHNRISIMREYLENENVEDDLCIDSDWLISWLASNVLLSRRMDEYYDLKIGDSSKRSKKEKILNPISKMRYMKNLSHLILYVLHCAKQSRRKEELEGRTQTEQFRRLPFADILIDPTSSLSQAQLYIISEYAYREIGVHRELRIFERLSSQLSHELPLYAVSNFYRDHLYHVIDVCLLGELLLRSMLTQKKGTRKYAFMADTFTVQTVSSLLHNWYVAALCHDIGYVIEQSDKFLNPIAEIKGQGLSDFTRKLKDGLEGGKKEIRETIKNIVETGEYVIPNELANKLINTNVSTDHGVVAWLHLRQWMKEIKYPKESLAPALTAILRHNLSDQEVDIRKEPLTFLLLLCDHIQEWGRPRIGPDPLARGIMEGLRFSEKPEFDRKVRMSNIFINGLNPRKIQRINISQQACENCVLKNNSICKTQCMRVQTKIDRKKGIRFTLPHVEARDADFEPCISWLMFCRDLQSINYRKETLPFPISITLKHAPSRIWSALGWDPLEMDIFEEYANTHPSATYLCEWIEFAKHHKEGIEYERDKEKGEEAFTINLHELGRPLKRDLSDEHWKDFFRWKWQWLSHKYTTSNLGSWYPEQK